MTSQDGKLEKEGWLDNQRAKNFRQAEVRSFEIDCKET